MVNPDKGGVDRDVDASMRMFERSQVGPAALVSPTIPARVLIVLDGSEQDATSIAAAAFLNDRFNVEAFVLDARDRKIDADGVENSLGADIATQISGARVLPARSGEAYEQILETVADHRLDLVMVPSPFGRSFDTVGIDSVGTVLDVLLSRCAVPMLVTRRADQVLSECCGQLALVVGSESDVTLKAASWMFGLAKDGAAVSLNLVVEKEQFENLRSIVAAIDPEEVLTEKSLGEALAASYKNLHAAMQRTAGERGLSYTLKPQAGEEAPPNPLNEKAKQMLVMPLEVDDRFAQGFVHDRIRRSPHPVLVIPSHVTEE